MNKSKIIPIEKVLKVEEYIEKGAKKRILNKDIQAISDFNEAI